MTQHRAGGGASAETDACLVYLLLSSSTVFVDSVDSRDDFTAECFNGLMKINSNRFLFCCQRQPGVFTVTGVDLLTNVSLRMVPVLSRKKISIYFSTARIL